MIHIHVVGMFVMISSVIFAAYIGNLGAALGWGVSLLWCFNSLLWCLAAEEARQ